MNLPYDLAFTICFLRSHEIVRCKKMRRLCARKLTWWQLGCTPNIFVRMFQLHFAGLGFKAIESLRRFRKNRFWMIAKVKELLEALRWIQNFQSGNRRGGKGFYFRGLFELFLLEFFPKQFTAGFSLRKKKGWPRYALAGFLELVRHVSAFSPPSLVHLVSALRRLQTLSAMCPPYVRFGFPPKPLPPCLGQALCPPVGFGHASKCCVSHVALCVRHVSTPCLFFVLPLSARCSLFIRSLSVFGRVYGLALAGPLSPLCPLFGFCAFVSSVSVVVRLSRGLCGCAFARCSSGHL